MIAHMMGKMLSLGRVTIPIELRRKYGWSSRTRLILRDEGDHFVVMTMPQYVHSLRGKYRGMGLMKVLIDDRQHEP